MSMAEFDALMTHTVTLNKMKRDYKGQLSVESSQVDLEAFVQYGNHIIRDEDKPNEIRLATAIVFLKNDATIDINHENWQVDQTAPYNRPNLEVIKIDPIDDPRTGNTHHWELAVI